MSDKPFWLSTVSDEVAPFTLEDFERALANLRAQEDRHRRRLWVCANVERSQNVRRARRMHEWLRTEEGRAWRDDLVRRADKEVQAQIFGEMALSRPFVGLSALIEA